MSEFTEPLLRSVVAISDPEPVCTILPRILRMPSRQLYALPLQTTAAYSPVAQQSDPKLLNEARWDLAWMLKMQDHDGGVRHKLTAQPRLRWPLPGPLPELAFVSPSRICARCIQSRWSLIMASSQPAMSREHYGWIEHVGVNRWMEAS